MSALTVSHAVVHLAAWLGLAPLAAALWLSRWRAAALGAHVVAIGAMLVSLALALVGDCMPLTWQVAPFAGFVGGLALHAGSHRDAPATRSLAAASVGLFALSESLLLLGGLPTVAKQRFDAHFWIGHVMVGFGVALYFGARAGYRVVGRGRDFLEASLMAVGTSAGVFVMIVTHLGVGYGHAAVLHVSVLSALAIMSGLSLVQVRCFGRTDGPAYIWLVGAVVIWLHHQKRDVDLFVHRSTAVGLAAVGIVRLCEARLDRALPEATLAAYAWQGFSWAVMPENDFVLARLHGDTSLIALGVAFGTFALLAWCQLLVAAYDFGSRGAAPAPVVVTLEECKTPLLAAHMQGIYHV